MRYLLAFVFFFILTTSFATPSPIIFSNGKATITLKDYIKQPFYWWPKTMLTYQVNFEKPVKEDEFSLTEGTNNVSFQFSDMRKLKEGGFQATLHFISDLPSGGDKTFFLQQASGSAKPLTGSNTSTTEGNTILIQTNKLSVRIPGSQTKPELIPGPVMQLYAKEWHPLGRSVLYPAGKQLLRIETTPLSSGPVFIAYKVTYYFRDSARYTATIKCIHDYDFIDIREEMSGINKSEQLYWKMEWAGLSPTHRQAPNHPYGGPGDKPGFERYNWETIGQKMLNSHHGVMPDPKEAGKIPFQIGLYQPWPAERAVTSAMFWDEKKKQSVGTFITDAASWNDTDYPIWQSSRIFDISFFYLDSLLSAEYPISEGTRATGMSCYSHQKDIDFMNELEVKSKSVKHPLGNNYSTKIAQLSYNHFLQNRFGTIDLNKVKDWILYYPENAPLGPVVFPEGDYQTVKDLNGFFFGGYNTELTVSGTRQNGSYSPVPARAFYETFTDGYNRVLPTLNKEDRERLAAMYLMQAYVSADEEYMPMKTMLSGHPNFLADVKTIPALAAFLFPSHPEAKNWANLYEKYVDLNTHYHTRPNVKAWNAVGGRWTENLSAYTWAFLRPTLQTNFLLEEHFDGKNRVANPNTSMIGNWLLNSLTAPYNGEELEFYRNPKGELDGHTWGVVTKETGPKRVHPPFGAHAIRRQPPAFFWMLGESLKNYSPLLSENIRYISHPDDQNMKSITKPASPFDKLLFPKGKYDLGTKPDFKSVKLTGYGNVLRAATGTKDDVSIHLMQIDQGPNYRWPNAGQGGSGSIYFYAGGKSYSNNGKEDAGDRKLEDTDLMTNFGVFKDGTFKSIGMNVLSRPLYDLGYGQFSELVPFQGEPYSWPQYQGRSLMLVGADYFITYDDVYNQNISGRFSWFTHPDEDLPELQVIKGGGTDDRNRVMKTELKGPESKGVYFDGSNDFMVFVSHKKGFKAEVQKYGARVTSPDQQVDYIFRNDKTITVNEPRMVFTGTAGFMRMREDGEQQLALFHGEKIGNGKILITAGNNDAGISVSIRKDGFINGKIFSPEASTISFSWSQLPLNHAVYIDGVKTMEVTSTNITIPVKGEHNIQITAGPPVPQRPFIAYTENDHGKVNVYFEKAAGAETYTVELSDDNAQTWKLLTENGKSGMSVKGAAGVAKSHVRITAKNNAYASVPSPAYPLYFTSELPVYPDGLKSTLEKDGTISLAWGEVLACPIYKLYRKKAGDKAYQPIYSGKNTTFIDKTTAKGIRYEYAVSAVNRNGESKRSLAVDNDPESWLHVNPRPGEKFRRTVTTVGYDLNSVYYPD